MTTPTDKPDLATLRIRRDPETRTPGTSSRKLILYAVLAILVIAAIALAMRGLSKGTAEVECATASLTYPSQTNAVLTASGYVLAQQKAAVASKGTGRLVYLGVEEGDKVRKGEVIARLEDQDVVAALVKSRADLAVAQADSLDAARSLERTTVHTSVTGHSS